VPGGPCAQLHRLATRSDWIRRSDLAESRRTGERTAGASSFSLMQVDQRREVTDDRFPAAYLAVGNLRASSSLSTSPSPFELSRAGDHAQRLVPRLGRLPRRLAPLAAGPQRRASLVRLQLTLDERPADPPSLSLARAQTFLAPSPNSQLINGQGIYNCSLSPRTSSTCTQRRQLNLPELVFPPDSRIRLRVIHSGAHPVIYTSVDEHSLEVIEADDTAVFGPSFHRVALNVAQRYSVLLDTSFDSHGDAFYLRAEVNTGCLGTSRSPSSSSSSPEPS